METGRLSRQQLDGQVGLWVLPGSWSGCSPQSALRGWGQHGRMDVWASTLAQLRAKRKPEDSRELVPEKNRPWTVVVSSTG